MNICLDLKGKYVKLIPYDEQYLDYLYVHLTTNNIEGFEECKLKQKNDLYRFMNNSSMSLKVFIRDISSDKMIGYIAGYNYNKVDGYIYITSILEGKENLNKEALNLFIVYLLKCFPIRKIYCEVYEKEEKKINVLKNFGFVVEAKLKEDTFFDGKYYDKYMLTLYREDYCNE